MHYRIYIYIVYSCQYMTYKCIIYICIKQLYSNNPNKVINLDENVVDMPTGDYIRTYAHINNIQQHIYVLIHFFITHIIVYIYTIYIYIYIHIHVYIYIYIYHIHTAAIWISHQFGWWHSQHAHGQYIVMRLPVAVCCNTLQHTATHCNTPQHTATHCNGQVHNNIHINDTQQYICVFVYFFALHLIYIYIHIYIHVYINIYIYAYI